MGSPGPQSMPGPARREMALVGVTRGSRAAALVFRRLARALRAAVLAVVLAAGAPCAADAQSVADLARPAATVPIARVTVDLAAGTFDRALPFDVPFFIAGRLPLGAQTLSVQYAEVPKSGDVATLVWRPQEPA